MDFIEKEGPSVPEAVFSACRALGIEEKDAQVQVLSDPNARRVKVRVGKPGATMPAGNSVQAPAPAPAPAMAGAAAPAAPSYAAAPSEPLSRPADYAPKSSSRPRPTPEQAEKLREEFEAMLGLMGTPSKVEVKDHAGNTIINITGEKEGLLIGKRGMTLDALQEMGGAMLAALSGNPSLYVVVDVADYRYRNERKIMDEAKAIAEKVLAEGGQQTMGPLDPAQRRLVHLELKEMPGVETFSVGDGARKKIVIQKKG